MLSEFLGPPLYDLLKDGECELLDMINRVLIMGFGWGPSDIQRHTNTGITIKPKLMAKHGGKLCEKTYQRSLTTLIDLNLLIVNFVTTRGARNVTPAWWTGVSTTDPVMVWRLAARRQEERAVDN